MHVSDAPKLAKVLAKFLDRSGVNHQAQNIYGYNHCCMIYTIFNSVVIFFMVNTCMLAETRYSTLKHPSHL